MAVKLFLNAQLIVDHVFPILHKNAYDATEVDKFLDLVIKDYRLLEENTIVNTKEYHDLQKKCQKLESENRQLEVELERYKARFTNIKPSDNVTTDNIDLLKRITVLENFLWAHGFNPDIIKK